MLHTKTNQFNAGHFSFLIPLPVCIYYGIDQKLPAVSWIVSNNGWSEIMQHVTAKFIAELKKTAWTSQAI